MSRDRLRDVKIAQKLRRVTENDVVYQAELISGSNIKTINGNSLLGAGNLSISGGISSGTAFPSGPTSGQTYFRTDLGWLCFYDGTRWLTCQEFQADFANQQAFQPYTATGSFGAVPVRRDYQMYLTRLFGTYYVGGANGSFDYWSLIFVWGNSASSETTIASTSSSSVSGSVNIEWSLSVNSPLSSSSYYLAINRIKTGTPGGLYGSFAIAYRLIVT